MSALFKLGRFSILKEIASGGMATVYLAELVGTAGFSKKVAIKRIHSAWSNDAEFTAMLIDEAKILVNLEHRNIVQVYELGNADGGYFIAMEYVSGLDLRQLQKRLGTINRSIPLAVAIRITREILAALEFAHDKKNSRGQVAPVIHRDISPQNILISYDGDIKLTDFGIAKVMGKSTQTQTGVLKGKFSYMSPEQASGRDLTITTDLFALGAVLFEMVTGRKCFDGNNDMDTLERVRLARVVDWSGVPDALQEVLKKALARSHNDRFASAARFDDALVEIESKLGNTSSHRDVRAFMRPFAEGYIPPEAIIEINDGANPTLICAETEISKKTFLNIPQNNNQLTAIPVAPKKRNNITFYYRLLSISFGVFIVLLLGLYFSNTPAPEKTVRSVASKKESNLTEVKKDMPELDEALAVKKAVIQPETPPVQTKPLPIVKLEKSTTKELKTYGSLTVHVIPWGKSSIDGQYREGSSVTFSRVSAGSQYITVNHPPSKKRLSTRVQIKSGKTVRCQADFEKKASLVCR